MSNQYTQEEVNYRANHVKQMKSGLKYSTINELELMAEGQDPDGLRSQFYSGKPDQFFKDVLAVIKG